VSCRGRYHSVFGVNQASESLDIVISNPDMLAGCREKCNLGCQLWAIKVIKNSGDLMGNFVKQLLIPRHMQRCMKQVGFPMMVGVVPTQNMLGLLQVEVPYQ